MRYFLGFLSTVLFLNCSSLDKNLSPFNKLEIETLVADSLMNIRALELTQKNVVAVSSLGDVYRYNLEKQSLVKSRFSEDTFNIRSIALVDGVLFSLGIGNPAVLYRDSVLVYFEKHPSVFYDSIDFWNSQEGIAMGDPTDGCMSILITIDAGRQWSKIPAANFQKPLRVKLHLQPVIPIFRSLVTRFGWPVGARSAVYFIREIKELHGVFLTHQ